MRRLMKRVFRKQHKGQSIVVLALGMIALLGFVGITTDISLLFVRYATLRRAVDAAAIAAAGQMRQDRSIATVSLTARSYIELHGLNPRDVWVESCQNQPRTDNNATQLGLQNTPTAVTTAEANYNAASEALSDAIAGGTTDLIALRDAYVTTTRAYISALEGYASTLPDDVVALQTTTNALINTYSTYATTVDISTNYATTNNAVLNYLAELGPLLPEDWTDDAEICTADQRKLVRVTAQVESPTVFLRLFGWQNILLEASAVSETAVLDVVIVMDVSESMMFDTVIQDWEAVHMAVAYLPPRIETKATRIDSDNNTVLGQIIRDTATTGFPTWTGFGRVTAETRAPDDPYAQPAFIIMNPSYAYTPPPIRGGAVANGYTDTYETWIDGWFWGYYLLGVPQSEVNRRLYYLEIDQPIGGEAPVGDKSGVGPLAPYIAPDDPNTNFEDIRNQYYQVRSFVPDDVTTTQTHPREACRVRFYPFSMIKNMDPVLAEMYVDEYNLTNTIWPNIENYDNPTQTQPQWAGFVPTYNFYGCCNDPSYALVDKSGAFVDPSDPTGATPFGLNSNNWANDGKFDDLVCQPMKQARDATRLFLERIDFLRGDRVGFVTFDKSAYIIDPDGKNGRAGFSNLSHMIEDLTTATLVLNSAIGVRAEPNYYVWNEDGGVFSGSGPWTGTAGVTQYSAGYNQNNEIMPVDYECDSAECPPPPMDSMTAPLFDQSSIDPSYLNYPVAGNCSIQNAELPFPYSRFATRNSGNTTFDNNYNPALYRIFNPPAYGPSSDPLWTNYSLTRSGGEMTTDHSYEKQGMCRGTNIGAALRVGNQALTDPKTTRRAGTVWIMILLSDGAAGASDPVRMNGAKIDQALPYEEVSRFDWRQRTNASPTAPNKSGLYGEGIRADNGASVARGGYGWLGLCPYGSPSNPGQLVKNPTGKNFPYCSDPDVFTRHFCLSDGTSVGYPDFGPGFEPGSFDRDYRDRLVSTVYGEPFDPPGGIIPSDWLTFNPVIQTEAEYILSENTRLGNIFDVDLGSVGNLNCDMLYDVDDYARDWADFVAGVDEEQSGDAVLPTIFTIGFRLEFEDRPHGLDNRTCEQRIGNNDSPEYDACMCTLNIEQCLGEELLRYIADAGDNFVIDNDLHQDWRNHDGFYTQVNTNKDVTDWGVKDPCENPAVDWTDPAVDVSDFAPRRGGESCGNYYNAPSVTELQQVFDDIASRMFTRLAG